MAARSACPAPSRSPSMRNCRGEWDRGCGGITTWSATPRSAWGRASSPFASTARRKSPCTTYAAQPLIRAIAQTKCIENPGKYDIPNRKYHHPGDDIGNRQGQQVAAREQRQQRLRHLVEAARPAARRQVQAALDEAGDEIAS